MPPYNNQMFPSNLGLPQAPPGMMQMGPGGQMGGIDMGMLQQYLAMMQGQQMRGGMESMNPDQGMNQVGPSAPPGWGGAMPMPKPTMNPGGPAEGIAQIGGPGAPNGIRMQFPGGSGPFMPPGMDPNMRFDTADLVRLPDGSVGPSSQRGRMGAGMEPGQGQLNQKPMFRDMRGQMPPQAPPQIRPDAPPPGPPPMRMPPGAGEWRNPATGQMMNQTPRFSGQNNPYEKKADVPVPSTPQTGGVMTASPSDVSPIKVPVGGSSTAPQDAPMVNTRPPATARPKTTTGGSAPFNPSGGFSSPAKKTRAATKAEMVTKKFSK